MTTNYRSASPSSRVMRQRYGAWLAAIRVEVGYTQTDLAEKMGWRQHGMVSQIERGLARLPPEDLVTYAAALGINPKEFTKKYLYYYDPDVFNGLFGGAHPLDIEKLPKDRVEHEARRGPRKPRKLVE